MGAIVDNTVIAGDWCNRKTLEASHGVLVARVDLLSIWWENGPLAISSNACLLDTFNTSPTRIPAYWLLRLGHAFQLGVRVGFGPERVALHWDI